MAAKMLTDAELECALQRARGAEKKARAKIAMLKRAAAFTSRRLDTQRKCVLGGTLLAIAERAGDADTRLVAYVCAFLRQNPPHESNRAALAGTPFAIEEEPQHV